MNKRQVQEIIDRIRDVRIAVYGDFCLDAYWILDPRGGEVSVETGIRAQAVQKQYYTLGGASNVVANLAALDPQQITAIGVIGNDIFGKELIFQLNNLHVDTEGMVVQSEDFDTMAFAKRYIENSEEPRIDFGYFNKRNDKTDDAVIRNIKSALDGCDVMIFNQQVPGSINDYFIDRANEIFNEYDDRIILLDSRNFGERFSNIYRKANEFEAARLNGIDIDPAVSVPDDDVKKYAVRLFGKYGKPVFITRGSRGILTADRNGVNHSEGVNITGRIDTVGAGDTAVSAIALALAGGFEPPVAAEFANIAAAVTVQKIFRTGTANADEILGLQTGN